MNSTLSERVKKLISALGTDQVGLGKLAGASKSVVNQWVNGGIKTMGEIFAYNLQRNTGYSAEWLQTGKGQEKLVDAVVSENEKVSAIIRMLEGASQEQIDQVMNVVSALLITTPKSVAQRSKMGRR